MKNRTRVIGLLSLLMAVTATYAQDTTRRSAVGSRIGVESGLQQNNSLTDIGQKLQQTNIDARAVGNTFSNFVASFVRDWPKHTTELRFLAMIPTTDGPVVSPAIRRARLYGLGIGFSEKYKITNSAS